MAKKNSSVEPKAPKSPRGKKPAAPPAPPANELKWCVEPLPHTTWRAGGSAQYWQTACGRYRAYRVECVTGEVEYSVLADDGSGKWIIVFDKGNQLTSPKRYSTLRPALEMAVLHLQEKLGQTVISNVDEVLSRAVELNMASAPALPKKADKAPKEPGSSKAPKAPKAPGAGVDKFNCRNGSQAADINACITDAPKSVEEVAKESGQSVSRIKGHLKAMINRGYVKMDGKNYVSAK